MTDTSRASRRWRSPIAPDTLSTLVVSCVLLLMPLLAMDASGWAVDLSIAAPVTIYGVLFGAVIAHSRFGDLRTLLLALVIGAGTVVVASALTLDLPLPEALGESLRRIYAWALDLLGDAINTDELVFTMLASMLFWLLALSAAWHLFRIERVWTAILPSGFVLLVNIAFFAGSASVDRVLAAWLLMALTLLARSNLQAQRRAWSGRGIRVPTRVRRQFAAWALALSILALAIAWSVPDQDLQQRLNEFQDFLASDPLQELAEAWSRVFAPIDSDGLVTTDYYGADTLELRGAVSLGDEVLFTVEAPALSQRLYWRSRVYERYSRGRWSPSADFRITDRSAPLDIAMNREVLGERRQALRQRFTISGMHTRLFYAAPQPQRIDRAGKFDLLYTDKPASAAMNVSVIRALQTLRPGDSYTAASQISIASADELRRAGAAYPDWVSSASLYIGLPNKRILDLAQRIVSDARANTQYDRARAIENWLRNNIRYNLAIAAPPANVDPVEWLLFDAQEGYCTYFATAMIVMLRHLGIPARLAAGFSQGEFDADSQRYIVRERDAHTWVEVYFPGYGWINFEPTADEAPVTRDGDDEPQDAPEQLTPEASASPSPTSSPTAALSPTATPTEDAAYLPADEPSPTATPTAEPGATSTPPAPPLLPPMYPQQPAIPPPPAQTQPLLIAALAAMSLFILLAIVAVLLFWWWEYRGFGGLTPISRAYARLERYIQLIGINVGSQQTTLEKRRELQRQIPAARESIRTISDLYTRERYGGVSQQVPEGDDYADSAARAWQRTRGNILRRWLGRRLPFLRGD